MNQYVIVYDTRFTSNCQQVTMIAEQRSPDDEIRKALAAAGVDVARIKNIRVVEIHPGDQYRLPPVRMWPFTTSLFDRFFAREQAQAEPCYWTGRYEIGSDGRVACEITYRDPKTNNDAERKEGSSR